VELGACCVRSRIPAGGRILAPSCRPGTRAPSARRDSRRRVLVLAGAALCCRSSGTSAPATPRPRGGRDGNGAALSLSPLGNRLTEGLYWAAVGTVLTALTVSTVWWTPYPYVSGASSLASPLLAPATEVMHLAALMT
jgi:hypothetical protein